MNSSDSERVSYALDQLGWKSVSKPENADLILFNTCSVRQKAEDRVVGLIKNYNKLKVKNNKLKIGITGCMVRKTGLRIDDKNTSAKKYYSKDKLFRWIKGLDFVFRIEDTPQLEQLLFLMYPETEVKEHFSDYSSYFKIAPKYTSKVQAFVPIMQGCNNFCAYCIVPHSRGREICRPLPEIINEIENLARYGLKEITLLGQNVNSYVLDPESADKFKDEKAKGKSDFVIILQEVNKIPGIKRIRYTSSHPKDFDDDLIQAHANLENLCKHLHLAVQSGDDEVLKRMNRHYTAAEFIEKMKKLRQAVPDIAITTDIIVGYCGETDAAFQKTLDLVNEVNFDVIYLAQYSPRAGTYAGDKLKDDIPHVVKAKRWHELNNLLKAINDRKNATYQGQTVEVLVEENKKGEWVGKTEDWKTVHFPEEENEDLIGELVMVEIEDCKTWIIKGKKV